MDVDVVEAKNSNNHLDANMKSDDPAASSGNAPSPSPVEPKIHSKKIIN